MTPENIEQGYEVRGENKANRFVAWFNGLRDGRYEWLIYDSRNEDEHVATLLLPHLITPAEVDSFDAAFLAGWGNGRRDAREEIRRAAETVFKALGVKTDKQP